MLEWYPRLAQAVSSYLLATVLHGGADPLEVAEFVGNRAAMDADSDHALAWLLWACRPRQVALLMVPTLLKWAERDDKVLTRASALSTWHLSAGSLRGCGKLPLMTLVPHCVRNYSSPGKPSQRATPRGPTTRFLGCLRARTTEARRRLRDRT